MTLQKNFVSLCLVAFLCCTGGGVDPSVDDGAQGSDPLRVTPRGNENLSYVTVQLPTGTCLAGGTCSKPLSRNPVLTLDGSTLAIGAETRILKGAHQVAVDGTVIDLNLAAREKKTITLAVAHRNCVPDTLPTVNAPDFGRTPSVTNVACPASLSTTATATDPFSGGRSLAVYYNSAVGTCTNLFYSAGYSGWLSLTCSNYASSNYIINGAMSVNGKCLPINSINAATLCSELQAKNYAHLPRGLSGVEFADRDLAYAPGEYQYDLSNGTSTTVKLKEADIVEVSVPLPVVGTLPSQFKTRIDFLSTRELPDAVTAVIGSSVSGERTYSVPVSSNASLNLKAYVNSSAAYSLTAAGRTVQLDQTQDNVVKLNRVDIDDVTITRENGTTYVVRGTYELYFGGNRVAGPYATNSGIDALPGDYELVIKYRTAEGDQTDRSTITL